MNWSFRAQTGRRCIRRLCDISLSAFLFGTVAVSASDSTSTYIPKAVLKTAEEFIASSTASLSTFKLTDPTASASSSAQFAPAAASDGNQLLVVWHDNRNGAQLDIYGVRIASDGSLLDPSGFAISSAAGDQSFADVTWNGTHFLVAWQDGRNGSQDIYSTRITAEGEVLEKDGRPVVNHSGDQRSPSVASLGGLFFIAWQDGRNGSASLDIYGARIDGAGTLIETNGVAISSASGNQNAPAAAAGASDFLVAWHDFRSGTSLDVYATRVGTNGVVRDPSGIPVSTAVNDQWKVSAAGNDSGFLVAWQDSRNGSDHDIFATRINSDGTVQDPTGLPVCLQDGEQQAPALSAIGSDFQVVWQDRRNGSDYDLYGTTIASATGASSTSNGQLLNSGALDQRAAEVVEWNGGTQLVWEDFRSGMQTDIYSIGLNGNGSPESSDPVLLSTVSHLQEMTVIGANDSGFFAVWRDYRQDSMGDLFGTRISTSGEVLDPAGIPISTAGNYQTLPRVAGWTNGFLVVWQDRRNLSHDDIYAARIGNDGTVLDPDGIPVSTASGVQRNPSVAIQGGTAMIVWQDRRSGSSDDIYGARMNLNDGLLLDAPALELSLAMNDQQLPDVAGLNGQFLAVWQDFQNDLSGDIRGVLAGSDGSLITTQPFGIATNTLAQTRPRIAAAGPQFLAVWEETDQAGSDIQAIRIGANGTPDVNGSFAVASHIENQTRPAITGRGGGFHVLWEDRRTAGQTNLYATRVTGNGAVLEPDGKLIGDDRSSQFMPSLAHAGSTLIAAFTTPDGGNVLQARAVEIPSFALPTLSFTPTDSEFVSGGGAVQIDPEVTLTDGETANYEGGTLTVSIIANATANDRLRIRHQGNGMGQIGISGNSVYFEGTLIGFYTGGGSGTSPLLIIFSAQTTDPAVEALARNLQYQNVAVQPLTQPRMIELQLDLTGGAGAPSTKTMQVIDANSIPSIVTAPVSQNVSASGQLTLSVLASGTNPLTYQWKFNGENIPGATSSQYIVESISTDQAGEYTVVVSNEFGSVESTAAIISLWDLNLYAGITLAGPIGSTYRIEYLPALANDNNWLPLTNVTLTTSPVIIYDEASGNQSKRFYRTIETGGE